MNLDFSYLWNSDALSMLQINNVIECFHNQYMYLQKWSGEVHTIYLNCQLIMHTLKLQFTVKKYFVLIMINIEMS